MTAGVLTDPARPALASCYTVAGRFICVGAEDETWARLFGGFFAGWHVSPARLGPGAAPDAYILAREGDAPRAPSAGFETFDVASGGRCHTDGETYFFEAGGSVVRVAAGAAPALVEVWVGRGEADREEAALARLVFNASMAAMRRAGLFELHAGAVVEPRSGAGVLFVGPSGSGKSTLTTTLASAGWRYLSDDSLLLRRCDGSVEAHALRRAFAVTAPTIEASGLDRAGRMLTTRPVPFDPTKRRFEPEAVFPGGFTSACEPAALFFPAVTREASSRVRPLTQAEAMARLLRMCPWACYDKPAAREHLAVLALLSGRCAAHELSAGGDLLGDAPRVAELVTAHLS
ncbi:MAG TPA: hypothetical protein VD968_11025 [Pyrinomonadaceae bacterium]|nr:hypothetical protein [Pyrinomonadaceae bacterium]